MSEAPPRPEIIQDSSLAEIRQDWKPVLRTDVGDDLKAHCLRAIDTLPSDIHGVPFAKSKLEEMIFWCRAAETAAGRRK